MFTLDRANGDVLAARAPQVQVPPHTNEFAINASNYRHWSAPVRVWFDDCIAGSEGPRGRDFNMRWIASMVAEAHRILMRGGVYIYPGDARDGLSQRARCGSSTKATRSPSDGAGRRRPPPPAASAILDRVPRDLHERVPLIFGSRDEVERIDLPSRQSATRVRAVAAVRPARPVPGLRRTQTMAGKAHRVDKASHHFDHRIVGLRHDVGEEDVRRNLPPREDHRRLHRGRRLPSLRPRRHAQAAMEAAQQQGNHHFSHFGPEANLIDELEAVFREYAEKGSGRTRHYVHDEDEAERYGCAQGTFTDWEPLREGTDLLFYEGLHGAVVTDTANTARYADLKIGVVPVINLEWIQKIHRDKAERGYSPEAVVDTILRRMPDYVNYICPQFTETDINFQRVPTVDTSNPFIARSIPTPDESMVVIRFRNPRGIDFAYLVR